MRSSYIVSTTPAMVRFGLTPPWMRRTVEISSLTPSRAKYSHCSGTRMPSAAASAETVRWPSDGGQSSSTKGKRRRALSRICPSRRSQPSMRANSTSTPTSSRSEGTMRRWGNPVDRIAESSGTSSESASYSPGFASARPSPRVALP